jgi:hypothetical protein
MTDRYNREERSYDRGEGKPESSGSLGDFPWQDSPGADQPAEVWEEPPATAVGGAVPGSPQDGDRNKMAIAGFVLSLLMFIPFPGPAGILNVLFWITALTFSSIGLHRSRKRGLPQKGLAIAGLCICLLGVVLLIILVALFAAGVIGVFD